MLTPRSAKPLVRHVHNAIKPGGGPAGYLLNLKMSVEQFQGDLPIDFDIREYDQQAAKSKGHPTTESPLTNLLKRIRNRTESVIAARFPLWNFSRLYADALGSNYKVDWISDEIARELFDCDLLVVHNVLYAKKLLELVPNVAKDRLVLITHCPTYYMLEVAQAVAPFASEQQLMQHPLVKKWIQVEIDVMKSIRSVAWPCPEAQEGYPDWYSLFKDGEVRCDFCMTGVPRPSDLTTDGSLKQKWGIDAGKKVALFIGRQHPHKGFDRFVELADWCASANVKDWVFVHAGERLHKYRGLKNVVQVGYVMDNAAAYRSADLVLIPNTYSYFDIGILEAMSLGAKIAYSPAGGHKYIAEHFPEIPQIPVGDAASTWRALELIGDKYKESPEMSRYISQVWQDTFAPTSFVKNHCHLVMNLIRTNSSGTQMK